MNTIRVKATIDGGEISAADWTNAKSLADSIKSACQSYGKDDKDFKFTVALVGEKNTSTDNDGTITKTEGVSVNGKINFDNDTWTKIQSLENSIQTACAAVCTIKGSSAYEIKTYVDKNVIK